jgi:hypothetical protein
MQHMSVLRYILQYINLSSLFLPMVCLDGRHVTPLCPEESLLSSCRSRNTTEQLAAPHSVTKN